MESQVPWWYVFSKDEIPEGHSYEPSNFQGKTIYKVYATGVEPAQSDSTESSISTE